MHEHITKEQFEKATQIEVVEFDNSSVVYQRCQNRFIKRYQGYECTRCQVCNTAYYSGLQNCECDGNDMSQYENATEEQVLAAMNGKTVYFN